MAALAAGRAGGPAGELPVPELHPAATTSAAAAAVSPAGSLRCLRYLRSRRPWSECDPPDMAPLVAGTQPSACCFLTFVR